MRYYSNRHSHRIARAVLVLVLFVGLALGTRYFLTSKGEVTKVDDVPGHTTENDSSPVSVISRVLATGNTSWGGQLYTTSEASSLKSSYPFSGLNTLSRNEYDVWIGNLVCSFTDKPDTQVGHVCPSGYLSEAKKWFNVFALGSSYSNTNSTLPETRQLLKSNDIQYVGDQDNSIIKQLCKVIILPARSKLGDGSYKIARMPLALCSVNAAQGTIDSKQYDEVMRYARYLPVWVYVQMGDTNVIGQTELQKNIYRSFIDVGADMVIGNHPYAVQAAENYKGKLIMYSLGNFMNEGVSGDLETQRSVSLKAVITSQSNQNMQNWMSIASDCSLDTEVCLKDADAKKLDKLAYTYDLSLVTTDNSKNGITMKSSDSWEQQAAKRLNWDTVMRSLSYTPSR
jgi:hypothetical protein